ncbi:phosphotransferase [Kitasatospora azatica]|uniref:phosphotransferase n=1 Tax=Kitasatospora azatica TaxID=58347 RepID=UPI000560E19A|nr:phosphotransferase [Kitasatospora azatica]
MNSSAVQQGKRLPSRRWTGRRLRPASWWAAISRTDPLLRNGHLLTVSSLLTAGVGAAYWALAAHLYGPDGVGRTYAAVSVVLFLSGVGQLNLNNTMIRFVPPAGRRTRRLVLLGYLAAATAALACGAGFVLLVPHLVPALAFLHTPLLGTAFAVATAGYAIFVMQDGVLTGLRRADWVVLENALFAVAKVLFLVLLAGAGANTGILGSWGGGLVIALAFTNTFLFARAIPRHQRRAPEQADNRPAAAPTFGYLAADWVGSLCWLAAITLPPIVVLNRLGAAASAYFSIAWLIGYALYQFAINMSASLIVEAADSPALLRRHCLHVLRHVGTLLGAAVLVVVVTAPWLLTLFGADYARGGTSVLRLLALSALPNLLVTVVVGVARVRRRMRLVVTVLAVLVTLVLGLTALLLPPLGIAGAGLAWLLAQCAVAAVLLARRSWWLPAAEPAPEATMKAEPEPEPAPEPAPAGLWATLQGLLPLRRPALFRAPADHLTARRLARSLHTAPATLRPIGRSSADVLVLRLAGTDTVDLAVKHPRSVQSRAALAHGSDVLRRLAADERLADTRRLLPRPTECRLSGPLPLTAESWLPGVTAEHLMDRRPERSTRLAALSLAAVARLHRATGQDEPTDRHLSAWVDQPLALLPAQIPWCRRTAGGEGLSALRGRLHTGLADLRLYTAWTHCDFHPGNVLLDEAGDHVTGMLDWEDARPDGPAVIDLYYFVLALRRRAGDCDLGAVIADLLRGGALSPEELGLIETAAVGRAQAPDPAALPLLAWLWHLAANLAKAPQYGRSHWWVARNVAPVLAEAARWPTEQR